MEEKYFKQIIGREGEDVAARYLEKRDYKILERNFSCKRGEIDIIALKNDVIIFVEIKARTSIKYGLPSEAVTEKKLKHLYKAAEFYLITRNLTNIDTRIDVIEVYKNKDNYRLNHLKQVM